MFDISFNSLLLWKNKAGSSYQTEPKCNNMYAPHSTKVLLPTMLLSIILPFLAACQNAPAGQTAPIAAGKLRNVADIPLPGGYHRINGKDSAFAQWLRQVRLK